MKLKNILTTAATATVIIQSAFAVPKLPEFQTKEQLHALRANQIANAERVQGSPPTFYTGKINETEVGKYLFMFRNYDAEVSRWTSFDPSGYPDGLNNSIYVNNWCLFSVDPNGKAITLYKKPVAFGMGSSWHHSYIYFEVKDCENKEVKGTVSGQPTSGFPNFGKLKSDPGSDMTSARNDGVPLDWAAAGWKNEYCFYLDLIGAQDTYSNNLDYAPDPAGTQATDYNSNGYIAGIMSVLGIAGGYDESTAKGWSVPVPFTYAAVNKDKTNCCE